MSCLALSRRVTCIVDNSRRTVELHHSGLHIVLSVCDLSSALGNRCSYRYCIEQVVECTKSRHQHSEIGLDYTRGLVRRTEHVSPTVRTALTLYERPMAQNLKTTKEQPYNDKKKAGSCEAASAIFCLGELTGNVTDLGEETGSNDC